MAGFGQARRDAYDRCARSEHWRSNFAGLTAFERHRQLLQQLGAYGTAGDGGADPNDPAAALAGIKTDADVLRQSYRFIRRPEDDEPNTWEVRAARRYYDRLFREYAIADLSRYQEQKVGLRWRTEAEVAAGKGQFTCGARGCSERARLASFELMFRYQEGGQEKAALVKVRACPACAAKLNHGRSSAAMYKPKKKEEAAARRGRGRSRSRSRGRRRSRSSSGGSSSSDSSRSRERRRRSKSGRRRSGDGERRGSGSSKKKRRARSRSRSRDRDRGRSGGRRERGRERDEAREGEAQQGPTDAEIERWIDDLFA